MEGQVLDDKKGRDEHLSWRLLLRLQPEWREPLEQIAQEMTSPTRRKPSLADVIREAIYQMLVQRGKIDDRRK
jgi:hypothetical protein